MTKAGSLRKIALGVQDRLRDNRAGEELDAILEELSKAAHVGDMRVTVVLNYNENLRNLKMLGFTVTNGATASKMIVSFETANMDEEAP